MAGIPRTETYTVAEGDPGGRETKWQRDLATEKTLRWQRKTLCKRGRWEERPCGRERPGDREIRRQKGDPIYHRERQTGRQTELVAK